MTNADCDGDRCIDNRCVAGEDAGVRDDGGAGSDAFDAGSPLGGECATSDDCLEGRCAGGICTMAGDDCASDGECDGDRYCCAEGCAPGGEAGFCVSYGEGPRGDTNPGCTGVVPIGLFDPSVQCEWLAPPDGDAFPGHVQVLPTPLVANLGNTPMTPAGTLVPNEILINSYNFNDGGANAAQGADPRYFGVLRVLNGQDCSQLETIHDPSFPLIGSSPPAIGDLDGDGVPEIVAATGVNGLIAFRYDAATEVHERFWTGTGLNNAAAPNRWDGPSIHDLDDDGMPEVFYRGEVFQGMTGALLNPAQTGIGSGRTTGFFSVIEDVDDDGELELVANDVFRWNVATQLWEVEYAGLGAGANMHSVADFGTASATGFDSTTLDGIAEIVSIVGSTLRVQTLAGDVVLESAALRGGGPTTVGDFDNDGFPEIASAGGVAYLVFDFECATASPECSCVVDADVPDCSFVRWVQKSQDASSSVTGSSIFDFEGDGQAEAVYADECFTRIYDGQTGDVLYSAFRTSCTWYENPVVADPDRDDNTEIIVGSNSNCNVTCPLIDPIHPGERCEGPDDCVSGMCTGGLCRCADSDGCIDGNVCAPSLDGSAGQVCRAEHPADAAQSGIRVLRDSLDRWASSRSIWNQHAYTITNVNEDGTIPRSSLRVRNHGDAMLNNYRQNAQGSREPGALADITGRLDATICRDDGAETRLVSTVCNRGERAVGAALPATFYLGPPEDGNVICTSFTPGPVPVGGCLEVSCELTEDIEDADVHVRVNDDGSGGATTFECEEDNNDDVVRVAECNVLI